MTFLDSIGITALFLQSAIVFCVLLGLGLAILAAGIFWARFRRRGSARPPSSPEPPAE